MESISFALEMRDSMSGPAQSIKASLNSLRGAIKGTTEATIDNQRAQLKAKAAGNVAEVKKLSDAIAHQRLDLKALNVQLKQTTQSEKDFFASQKEGAGGGLSAIAGPLALVAAGLVAVVAGVVLLGAAGIKFVADAAAFRTHMTNAFDILGMTAGKGKETYESIKGLAATLPQSRQDTFDSAQELMAMGLKGDIRLENTVRSIAQAKAVLGDAAGGKLKSMITAAQGTTVAGRFIGAFAVSPEDLRAIGLTYESLGVVLGKQIGKTNAEATQMLREGRVSAAAGIDALNMAVSRGKIGAAAIDAMNNLGTIWDRFKDNLAGLFDGVDMKPFMAGLSDIVDLFKSGSETGKGWTAIIQAVFGGLGTTGSGVVGTLKTSILELQNSLLKMAINFAPTLQKIRDLGSDTAWLDEWKTGFKAVADSALLIVDAIMTIAKYWDMFKSIAGVTMRVSGAAATGGMSEVVIASGGALAGAGGNKPKKSSGQTLGGFDKFISELSFFDVPTTTSASIKQGEAIGSGLIKGVGGPGGIDKGSPSRKMRALGVLAVEGFDQGLATAGPGGLLGRIGISAGDLTPSNANGNGGGVNLGGITLNISGVSDSASLPAMLEPLFADLLERIAEEVA